MADIKRIVTNPRRGRAVIYNGMLFIGGQTAHDKSLDIKGQTSQVLEKIDKILAEAGTDRSNLLTAQIWIRDIQSDFAGMNEVWDGWVSPDALPTRATAQCQMASAGTLVEIVVTAAVPQ
jgi:enamine deaminase RidA (YjgF/YER057c/UK114 family)